MSEKIYLGKVTARENKFGGVETNISFGPQDWAKIGINCNEWKNFTLKSNKDGKPYLELNNWAPKQDSNVAAQTQEEVLPF